MRPIPQDYVLYNVATTFIMDHMLTATPPEIVREIQDTPDLTNDHGWPQELCLVSPSPDKYACNCADTEGLEPDPQHDIHGLAVFVNEESAKTYMGALNGLSGEVVAKSFEECRQIAVDRPKLNCMFLMDGSKIHDLIYVR